MTLPGWLTPLNITMPTGMGKVNLYLIRTSETVALIDTGMSEANCLDQLKSNLNENGLALADIDFVICTHHHLDHAGLGRTLSQAGAETMMSADDAESLKIFFEQPELDETRATFYGRHEVPQEIASRASHLFPFFRQMSEHFDPSLIIEDQQVIDLGGVKLEVIITPGHTRGHVCLVQYDEGLVFTGDCVLADDATHVSMRPESQGTDPMGRFLSSLGRLKKLGKMRGLTGHGRMIDDMGARCEKLISHHTVRLEDTLRMMTGESASGFDISQKVMGYRKKTFHTWLALSQMLAYLEHLVQRGDVMEVEVDGKVRFQTNT